MPSYSSSSSSFSKSKSKPQWRNDVFINFRGEDTRRNFVSHLYSALIESGVNAFLDDEKLAKGEEQKSELLHAIEGSQISIVVFSRNYIHSTWCLDELLKIMECHAFRGQVVLPVFYDIGPSFLRDAQYISFEVISNQLNRIKPWKKALSQAANLAGWDMRNYRSDNDVMKEIVGEVLKRLDKTYLSITKFPVGLESRLQHDRGYVTEILNGCGLHADIGITVLVERSLIKVEKNNKLGIHHLLRDMGREIVRQSSPLPQRRSRLWLHNHVLDILTEHTRTPAGTEAIEGLALKLQRTSRVRFSAETFEEMKRLRLLQFDHVQLAGDYGHLSKHLRWVYWRGFSSKFIPDNFYQGNVVAIDMKHSNLKLVWKEPLHPLLEGLKFLNLSHSKFLSKTPNFSNLPNLERLILKDCPSLSEVHHSIGDLRNLLYLNLKDCTCLQNLPVIIYKLKSLKVLILSGCSKIDKLEEDIVQMESLTTLIAHNTSLKQVPFSIVRSKKIGYLSFCGYEGSARDIFPSIIWSWMTPTRGLVSSIQSFGSTSTSLVSVYIQDNNLSNLLSEVSEFPKLRSICVQCYSDLQLTQKLRIVDDFCNVNFAMETTYASQISESSMVSRLIGMGSYYQVMDMLNDSISEVPSISLYSQVFFMIQVMKTHSSSDFVLPGDNYPYWLAYTGEGYSVPFQVPDDSDCPMKGMTLCAICSSTPENMATESLASVFIFNYTKYTIQIYKQSTTMSSTDEDWAGIISNLGPGDNVEIFVCFGHGMTVEKTGVYLIFGQSVTRMEPSPEVSAPPSGDGSVLSSPEVEMEPSLNAQMEPSLNVQMELSKKPKKDIFSKSAKKMKACFCLS
ncbi:unnamed protein product [Sphenostylis stenocarpa]|uniref:TIR domain-containing protein n=1 Tax=Sphenostylis stenocarpa TaxID=92480 RepID=A0AA86SGZ1_9FABA|nr:unnamed protein product [Sphenostylis stenocarpa]